MSWRAWQSDEKPLRVSQRSHTLATRGGWRLRAPGICPKAAPLASTRPPIGGRARSQPRTKNTQVRRSALPKTSMADEPAAAAAASAAAAGGASGGSPVRAGGGTPFSVKVHFIAGESLSVEATANEKVKPIQLVQPCSTGGRASPWRAPRCRLQGGQPWHVITLAACVQVLPLAPVLEPSASGCRLCSCFCFLSPG